MSEQVNINNGGTKLLNLLVVLFIALKLCGVITWSWWWVLSPIWISLGIAAVALTIVGIWASLDRK